MKTFLVLILFLVSFGPAQALGAKQLTCKLESDNTNWTGSCDKYNGNRLQMSIAEVESVTSGKWRSDREPVEVWRGVLKYGKKKAPHIEIEHHQTGVAFARTTFGWFKITDWSRSDDIIEFVMHTDVRVAPSRLDYLIIQTARKILASEDDWNREDNRKCPEAATTWSIYCALILASVEVSGGYHHRRPALQVVRTVVQKRRERRSYRYRHPLMDYNNDKTTQIEDVGSLFDQAEEIIIRSIQSGSE